LPIDPPPDKDFHSPLTWIKFLSTRHESSSVADEAESVCPPGAYFNPPIQGGMIHVYASPLHHLLQVPIDNAAAAVPTHIQQDDFWQKVTPFKTGCEGHGKLTTTKPSYRTIPPSFCDTTSLLPLTGMENGQPNNFLVTV